jgi:hypothetical protein
MKKQSPARKKVAVAVPSAPLRRRIKQARPADVNLGRLVGVGSGGEPWIDLPRHGLFGVQALATVPLGANQVGREVVVSFIDGQADRPVVVGVVRRVGDPATAAPAVLDAVVDGERILLTGQREIVLRCGKASIALDAQGKVVIKGVSLLATSSELPRIRGGAVQIN